MFKFGLEVFLQDRTWQEKLANQRLALVAHPASVDQNLNHAIDLFYQAGFSLSACFGPQHGMRGEKQDNMIESDTYSDPQYEIPVYSLYGDVRKPTPEMLDSFDVLIFDLQDVGCRIYTFVATLVYLMEACHKEGKKVIVLDRPNPAGRPIEGSILDMNFETFVGAAPLLMRHSLTIGEIALWYKASKKMDIDLEVVPCEGYDILKSPWPERVSWVNPSPNLPRQTGVLAYAGTVLVEGASISEGRGTTTPLEVIGDYRIDGVKLLKEMNRLHKDWLSGCVLRPCFFEPTFQKQAGKLCSGFQIHLDLPSYSPETFQPYRLVSLTFKAIRSLYPDFGLWNSPPYEYETSIPPIDMLSGCSFLRQWVDDSSAGPEDLDQFLNKAETHWSEVCRSFYLY